MGKRKRRYFSPEYKAEVVKLVHEGKAIGKSVGAISKELGLIETAVRGWVKKAEGTPTAPKEPVAATAREQELLREIRVLKMERDILKNRQWLLRTCFARNSVRGLEGEAGCFLAF